MLAPVLARLDAVEGVAGAAVDASGQFFWIRLTPGADPGALARRAREALGDGARVLTEREAEAQLARRAQGDPWFTARDLLGLSLLEARVLASRITSAAVAQVSGAAAARALLAEALRDELSSTMERVHAEGGRARGGWIDEVWPALTLAAVERCGDAIPASARPALLAALRGLLRP